MLMFHMGQKFQFEKKYYSAIEVAVICGLESVGMVDHICQTGIVKARRRIKPEPGQSVRGSKRFFHYKQLLIFKIFQQIFKAGMTQSQLKLAMTNSPDFRNFLRSLNPNKDNFPDQLKLLFFDSNSLVIKVGDKEFLDLIAKDQLAIGMFVNTKQINELILENLYDTNLKERIERFKKNFNKRKDLSRRDRITKELERRQQGQLPFD